MPTKRKRAEIIEVWAEKVRNRPDPTWARVARDLGIDYKWLCDFINDGVIAEQVIKVKKLDRYFGTGDMDLERYRSERVKQTVEEFKLG